MATTQRNRISVACLLTFLILLVGSMDSTAQPFSETKFTPSDGGNGFGVSVSIFGETALIGAYADNNYTGSAYVFELKNESWNQVAKLAASDGWFGEYFGQSVSLYGDQALIGVWGSDSDDGLFWTGSAYIFERRNGTWTESAKLRASDQEGEAEFGNAVSIHGDWAIVGSHLDSDYRLGIFRHGSAYIFEKQNGNWLEVAKLTASDIKEFDVFGNKVSISNGLAFVNSRDATYIFERQGETWTEVAKLAVNASSVSGERFMAGSRIFERSGNTWAETAKLEVLNEDGSAQVINSVSISGDRIIMTSSGAVHVFDLKNGAWVEVAKLTASDGATLIRPVSLSGNLILVGVAKSSAYLFDLDPPAAYRIDVLSTQVDDLYAEGLLEKRQHSQLSGLLDQALASYNSGYLNNPVKSMQQFVDFTEQLLALNHLPDEDAQSLIDQGQAIIDKIEEEAGTAGKNELSITESSLQDLPETFVLEQNHPNPFNPSTVIRFTQPELAAVRLTVYDMLGREVERLVDGVREAGNHEVTFNASSLPSGTYLYRLETPEGSFTQRMLLLK